jgi:hypothetical protein
MTEDVNAFSKVSFVYSTSHGMVPMELARQGTKMILVQLPSPNESSKRYERPIMAINDIYNFYLERSPTGLSITHLELNSNDPLEYLDYLHMWVNLLSKGFISLPEFIPYADIDFDDQDWGFVHAEQLTDRPDCYMLTFRPTKGSVWTPNGVFLKYDQIKEGKIVVDKSKNFLPVSAYISYSFPGSDQVPPQALHVEVTWNYSDHGKGIFLPAKTEMRYYGDGIENYEPNEDWKYRIQISDINWQKDVLANEFLVSRFGFTEPVVPKKSLPWIWLIVLASVLLTLVVGMKIFAKRKIE